MSKEEAEIITKAAERKGETKSGYARRVLMESAQNSIYMGRDVMQSLWRLGKFMNGMTRESSEQNITLINTEGESICRILSTK